MGALASYNGLGDDCSQVISCIVPGTAPLPDCSACECVSGALLDGQCVPVVVGQPAPLPPVGGGGGGGSVTPVSVLAQQQAAAAAGTQQVGCDPSQIGCNYQCNNGVWTTDPTLSACPGILDQLSASWGISSGTIEMLLIAAGVFLVVTEMGGGGRRR
jgi:hypothetical protein